MNPFQQLLEDRESKHIARDDSAVIDWLHQGLAPEIRLIRFDAWAYKTLDAKLDWAWAGGAKEKRIQQCRIYLERIVLDLWRRGWLLDGRRLAAHIERALDQVAAYQRKGAISSFWPYFQACISRYVGANAEEIREEAMRAGSHMSQALTALGIRASARQATLPELIAQRTQEIRDEKQATLRSRIASAKKNASADNQQELL